MRRGDKEITSRAEIDRVIHSALSCRMAMVAPDGTPRIVPLSFGYDGETLTFHSAAEGEKIDILRSNPEVAVEFEDGVTLRRGGETCSFSMNYESVVARGRAEFLTDPAERRTALERLAAKYAGEGACFPDAAMESLVLFRVRIASISGKRSPVRNPGG
jgi:nitroimidazol reductase NimA-like FMN-containing flavoprotein (pyridoxamine 5'-phosphate oxidase superfamily)